MSFRPAAAAACMMLLGLGRSARADALAALGIYAAAERRAEASPMPQPARRLARRTGRSPARSLLFPIPGGARLSSGWGLRRDPFSGSPAWHDGVDLAAYAGTPIVAAHSGWCSRRYSSGSGLIVRITSARVVTEYRHLSSIEAKEGPIRAGETLGKVGSTGSHSTGPHLHYAVWLDGRQVDPIPLLKAQWRS